MVKIEAHTVPAAGARKRWTAGALALVATLGVGCATRGPAASSRAWDADAVELWIEEAPTRPHVGVASLSAVAPTSMLAIREMQTMAASRGLHGIDRIDCPEPSYVACTARGFVYVSSAAR